MGKRLTLAELANRSAPDRVELEIPTSGGDVVAFTLREPLVSEALQMRSDFMAATGDAGRIDRSLCKWFKKLAKATDDQYVALVRAAAPSGYAKLTRKLMGLAGFNEEEGADADASEDASFPAGS